MGSHNCVKSKLEHRHPWGVALSVGLMVFGLSSQAQAMVSWDLVRCADTAFAPKVGAMCGGDSLSEGSISIIPSGEVAVKVRGALGDPFGLYEVYWLSFGDPVTTATYIGNFTTDCAGDGRAVLRDITKPIDIVTSFPNNIFAAVGAPDVGIFLVYSRGPMGFGDLDGDCRADEFNTVPLGLNLSLPLANPPVNLGSDIIQFISGYRN